MDEQTISTQTQDTQDKQANIDLGTFKDVEALKKSYDSLRSEFTRKSQELSRLQKAVGDKEEVSTPPSVADVQPNANEADDAPTPFWEKEHWQHDVDEFFKGRELTDEQKSDLAQLLLQDKEVQQSPSPLYVAYAKMLENNAKNVQHLSKNQDFLEKYIFNDENIKNKIIKDYISSLNKRDNIPEVMPELAANFGEVHTAPKTLNEAKQLASKYFD